jgi:hypothetical protein
VTGAGRIHCSSQWRDPIRCSDADWARLIFVCLQ